MSKNILQQLFDGEVYPSESLCVGIPEYRKLVKVLFDERQFFKTLNDGNLDRFKKIEDLYAAAQSGLTNGAIYSVRVDGLRDQTSCTMHA